MDRVIEGLTWRVVSPSRYELVGDNRVVVWKRSPKPGWAIMIIDGQNERQSGGLIRTRDEAMQVVRYAHEYLKRFRLGPVTTVEEHQLALHILGPYNFSGKYDYDDPRRIRS